MIKTYTLIVGLNDKDSRRQEVSTSDAKRILADIVLRYSDGATFTTCEGVYRHADGGVVFETSIKIEVFGITPDEALEICATVRETLNQECVYKQTNTVESVDFI